MGIRKKIFMFFITVSTVIFCISYIYIYHLFNRAMEKDLIRYQESAIALNANMVNIFTDFVRRTTLLLIGDQSIGKNLSVSSDDPMERIRAREQILVQFSHYINAQSVEGFSYRNTLFLNDTVPLASRFEQKTLDSVPYGKAGNVYFDLSVRNTDWYGNVLQNPDIIYVFVNENTRELCLAQKFQSSYYTGPYNPKGQGVTVTSIPMNQIENTFDISPVTPNSGFILFNQEGAMLYNGVPNLSEDLLNQARQMLTEGSAAGKSTYLTADNQKYVVNASPLNYGLSALFVTPYSDITKDIAAVMTVYASFALCITIFTIILYYIVAGKITKPIIYLSKTIGSISDTRKFDDSSLDSVKDRELVILCSSFKELIQKVNDLIEDIRVQGENEKKAELKALQAQINPHFIFNAMDVVNWLALSRNEDDIAAIVNSIASLMRYSITEADSMVDISRELENIREFISIYQLRHRGNITLVTEGECPPVSVVIPKFSIQPLVENSIRHGMIDEHTPLKISITVKSQGDLTVIEIRDNGKGCDPGLLNAYLNYEVNDLNVSNGFGIRNVNQRIKMRFHQDSGLSYYVSDDGRLTARVTLRLNSMIQEGIER